MRYALLLVLAGLGLVYFIRQSGPPTWSNPTFPVIESTKNLGSSLGSAFKNAGDMF